MRAAAQRSAARSSSASWSNADRQAAVVAGRRPEGRGGVQAPAQMAGRSLVGFAVRGQLAGAVLADGLQGAVAGPGRVRGGDQEALVGEPGQRGRDRAAAAGGQPAHRACAAAAVNGAANTEIRRSTARSASSSRA